jgi:hypothetical protein
VTVAAILGLFTTAASAGRLPETLTTPTGNFITLHTFEPPTSRSHIASADVEICTSAHTPKGTVAYPPFFTLSLTNGTSLHIDSTAAKTPGLKPTPLGPKQCVRGWISFTVPAGGKVSALVYTYGPPIRWKLT